METTKIVVWPDDTWCRKSHLEEYNWKSDDYYELDVDDTLSDDEIDLLDKEVIIGLKDLSSKEYDGMIDFMRADLDSGMRLSKIEMMARKLIKEDGRDFDEEFTKWKEEQHG